MPLQKLALKPGMLAIASQLAAGETWWSGFCVRFFLGFLQKLGGWLRLTNQTFVGTCRALHGWADLLGNSYLAIGTEQRLQVYEGGVIFDITPLRATTNPSPAFTTVNTHTSVQVGDTAHGASAGDWVNIFVPVSIGGLIIQGLYLVQTVVDANNYTIDAASAATSSAGPGGAVPDYTTMNTSANVEVTLDNHGLVASDAFTVHVAMTVGGITIGQGAYAVLASPAPTTNTFYIVPGATATSSTSAYENSGNTRIQYLLPSGNAVNTALLGYGIGDYGSGDYGLSDSSMSATGPLRSWALDHWGEALLASPTNLGVYVWTPPFSGLSDPATVVATAPEFNWRIFVIGQLQILVSLGAESGGTQYPNLVRWSDVGDYTDFTPSATNEAGSFQIPTGSSIVAGLSVGLGALIWTNIDLWSMTYEGLPFVFGFNRVATVCEAMSSRAPAVIANAVMWPSVRGFFRYDGSGVNFFPCPVWDFLFANIDYGQLEQLTSAVNTPFNEVAWFFPFAMSSPYYSASTPYGYVKFNTQDGVWDYGVSAQLQRTAWEDHPSLGATPIGTDLNNYLQQHEISPDADGIPLAWSATSGYADIEQGEEFGFVDWFLPDVVATPATAQITVSFATTDYSGDQAVTYGPYPFTPATEFLTPGLRGRQIAITIGGNDLGSSVRLGASRYRVAPDGRN